MQADERFARLHPPDKSFAVGQGQITGRIGENHAIIVLKRLGRELLHVLRAFAVRPASRIIHREKPALLAKAREHFLRD